VLAEEPEVAGPGHRLVGWLGDVVGIDEAVLRLGRCQGREHRRECLGVDRDLGEQLAELGLVGRGHRGERVEAGQHEPLLVLGQVDVEDRPFVMDADGSDIRPLDGDGPWSPDGSSIAFVDAPDDGEAGGADHDRRCRDRGSSRTRRGLFARL